MGQPLFSVCWSPEEVGASADEGVDLPVSGDKQARNKSLLLPSLLNRLPPGVGQI